MQSKRGKYIFNIALGEISILILALFAFSFLVGQFDSVSAQTAPVDENSEDQAQQNLQTVSSLAGVGSTAASLIPPSSAPGPTGTSIIGAYSDINTGLTYDSAGNVVAKEYGRKILNPTTGDFVDNPDFDKGTTNDKGVGIGTLIKNIYTGQAGTSLGIGALVAGLAWGGTIAGAIKILGGFFTDDERLVNSLAVSALVGGVVGGGTVSLLGALGQESVLGIGANTFGAIVGVGAAVAVFLLLYKKESTKYVQLQCLPWEAPLGGAKCEECNNDPEKPCSEYRCKSLGQACDLVNEGTKEEKCVWVSPQDVNSPTIAPWSQPLTEGYQYVSHQTRPPSLGTRIVRNGACVQPFTALKFGVALNEPGQCKIDYIHTEKFDDMAFYFGESNYYRYNHTQQLRLPSPSSIRNESPELGHDGTYNLYVRCRDANGNENVDEFVFNFCVDESPDTTPPVIEATSILSGSPVSFGVQKVPISVYVNEPAECKWSRQDKAFADMENSMSCSTKVYEQNAQQLYACNSELTGIQDRADNNYFFRCKDQPGKPDSERNVNTQSFKMLLKGSQELNIISVQPNETIIGSTDVVSVDLELETSNGANEGQAICYFSASGDEDTYLEMFETDSFEHRQTLSLGPGQYNYHFRCVDAGGNSDTASTSFTVFADRQAPFVTRVYREVDALKVVTNEDAQCAYSLNNCNFNINEGIQMIYSNAGIKNNHFAPWKASGVYYVKCMDEYGNQPSPNLCSIIVSATNFK